LIPLPIKGNEGKKKGRMDGRKEGREDGRKRERREGGRKIEEWFKSLKNSILDRSRNIYHRY